ncbi:MAG: hypothetical protein AAGB18_04410 [Pseudomonadota bacterium]
MTLRKIATCCYCGTRATLVLSGKDRHELACSNCGAPLHDLKKLPSAHPGKRELVKPSNVRSSRDLRPPRERKRKKRKPRKSFGRRFFEEALDVLEDILD